MGEILIQRGAGGASGSGIANRLVRWLDALRQGSSLLSDDGTNVTLTSGKLLGTGQTVTSSQPLLDLSQTWNAAGITFTGAKLNITSTASAAASLLMDLQIGGVSQFSVQKDGQVKTPTIWLTNTDIKVRSVAAYSWSATSVGDAADLFLYRDGAANILAQRNGANAQTQRWAETFTDSNNYSRAFVQTSPTLGVIIGSEALGTGSQRPVRIRSSLGTPGTPADGDWWVECVGTTPNRVAAMKVQDGGVTRLIASITY